MKTILIAVAAAAALTTALPAAAQPRWDREQRWDRDTRPDWVQARRIDEREMRIEQRIRNGQRRRVLSPSEARNFRLKLNQTEQIERRYKRSGRDLTRNEVGILHGRLDNLEREIRRKVRD